jgi:hypothetical protein
MDPGLKARDDKDWSRISTKLAIDSTNLQPLVLAGIDQLDGANEISLCWRCRAFFRRCKLHFNWHYR